MMNVNLDGDERLLLVDSFALLFRGYYATAMHRTPKPNQKGLYTNGLQQLLRYLFDAVNTFQPTHVMCAIDMGKETFRNELYAQYKANRGEPPAELVPQFELLREVLAAYEIPVVGVTGFEADDLLGTMAHYYADRGVEVQILTGDADVLQCVRDGVEVVLLKKGLSNYERVNTASLEIYNGLQSPAQVIEWKALVGDPSDNIPGCPNVGPKTALKLLQQFGDVEGIYNQIEQVQGKVKEYLLAHREQVELSRRLATIRLDAPYECRWPEAAWQWNPQTMTERLEAIGMKAQK